MFTDTDALQKLSSQLKKTDKSLWGKIKTFFGEWIAKLKKAYAGMSPDSELAKIARDSLKNAENLQQLWVDAAVEAAQNYRQASEGQKNNTAGGDVLYSYRGKNSDGIEVYETSNDIMSMTWSQRKAKYADLMSNEFNGRTARFMRNGHIYYAQFDKTSTGKILYGEKGSSRAGLKAITKSGADGDVFDIVENSVYKKSAPDTKNHKAKDGFTEYFDYFYKTVQIDGKVFDIDIDVKKQIGSKHGYTYTIKLRDNTTMKAFPAVADLQPLRGQGTPSDTKVTHPDDSVKLKSTRDSDENALSKAQQEYFKDSKVRDEDGNLRVVYHGTEADFTVFDPTKSRANMDIQGMFFSPWGIDAGGYGGNVKAYYLDIKNPASESVGYKALNLYKGQNEAGM